MKYIFLLMPIGLLVYVFYLYDQYWPNEIYLKEYEKIKEMKEHLGNRIIDGAPEPDMPDFYNNNTTLYGIDKNKNGVRDDVEIWINLNARSKLEKEMYVNYARSIFYFSKEEVENTTENDLIDAFRSKHLKRIKNRSCLNVVCSHVNANIKSNVECSEIISQFNYFINNTKVRDSNLHNISDDFDFSFGGQDSDVCENELSRRIKNDTFK
jgi:archaellum component FlaF (FlaF/FlaG flagellin family)